MADDRTLGERFDLALDMAHRYHGNQKRKGTETPYFGHLLGVASLVVDEGGDEDEAIAALLHDAAEDQGGEETLEEIREEFGERVARIVHGLSDTFEDPKPPWQKRKQDYLDHLRRRPTARSCWSRSPTSSTTPARSCSTGSTTARRSGTASPEARKAASGTTASWSRSSTESFPGALADELRRTVARIGGDEAG